LRLKILKKLRTASLNSEFTGSYKKGYFTKICLASTLTLRKDLKYLSAYFLMRKSEQIAATFFLYKIAAGNGQCWATQIKKQNKINLTVAGCRQRKNACFCCKPNAPFCDCFTYGTET